MEWVAVNRQDLKVPPERSATQRFRFTAPAPIGLSGSCAEWIAGAGGGVTLHDVLIDTSQRVHGTTLEYRVTHRRELTIIGAPIVVFPINDEERSNG
jgi:hypothetical protein